MSAYDGHHCTNKAKAKPHEWCLPELATKLRVPIYTMQRWRQRGWVHARRVPGAPNCWFIWADQDELKRLAKLRSARHNGMLGYPLELKAPKARSDRG